MPVWSQCVFTHTHTHTSTILYFQKAGPKLKHHQWPWPLICCNLSSWALAWSPEEEQLTGTVGRGASTARYQQRDDIRQRRKKDKAVHFNSEFEWVFTLCTIIYRAALLKLLIGLPTLAFWGHGDPLDRWLRAPQMVCAEAVGSFVRACGGEVASEKSKDKEKWMDRLEGQEQQNSVRDELTIRSSGILWCRFVSSAAPQPPAVSAGSCSALYPSQSSWRRSPPA